MYTFLYTYSLEMACELSSRSQVLLCFFRRYFIVGEFYQMGRGIFLFVGGPLASLIAPVRRGHLVFYFINSIQAFILLTILVASWQRYVIRQQIRLLFCDVIHAANGLQPFVLPLMACRGSTGFSRCARTSGCALKHQCQCSSCLSSTIEFCR